MCYRTNIIKLLFVFFFSFISLYAFPQQTDLKQQVTLNVKQESFSNIFSVITQQTGLRFSYNSQLFNASQKTSVQVTNAEIDKVLAQILPSSVVYKQVGKYIILSAPIPEKKQAPVVETAPANNNTVSENVNGNIAEIPAIEPFQQAEIITEEQEKESEIISDLTEIKKNNDSISLKNSIDTIFIQKKQVLRNGILPDSCLRNVTTINIDDMNKKLALLVLSLSTSLASTQATETVSKEESTEKTSEAPIGKKRPLQATFVYPLGTDGISTINNEYGFSLNIIGGNTGKISGTEIGSVYNINKYGVDGVQISGAINIAGTSKDAVEGKNVQIAGVLNQNRKGTSEQIAGAINMADNSGFQAAGVLNVAKQNNVQVAGAVNIAKRSNTQIAGITNIADTANVQIGGAVNVASSSSCQIAGLVNVTKKGGFQLGVVNVRDTTDGVSLGIVNIVKKGGIMEFGIESSEVVHGALTFRSGTRKLYSIISVGYNFSDKFTAVGFGLGTQIPLVNRLSLDIEAIHYNLYDKEFKSENYNGLVQIRPLLDFKIANHLKIYAGPAINLSMTKDMEFSVPYSIWEDLGDRNLSCWVGFTAGIKF